jgi:tRNA(fMet)-specific endonuclease VapC
MVFGYLLPLPEMPRRSGHSRPFVQALDFPEDAAEHYAGIRADLERRGEPIGANDPLIAAHARSHGLALVTNNTEEPSRFQGLALENWAA